MKVVEVKELENCFDGSFIKEILFDSLVTKDFIHYIGQTGLLQYFSSFVRPFYKVENPGRYILKGVEGNMTVRIILNRSNVNDSLKYFHNLVMEYNEEI